jgi:hypothetical protein
MGDRRTAAGIDRCIPKTRRLPVEGTEPER